MDEDLLERLKAYFESHFLLWSSDFGEYFLQQLIIADAEVTDEKFRNITMQVLGVQ